MTERRPVLAVIGRGEGVPDPVLALAEELGTLAVEAGFRVATGGLDGVMAAAARGARGARGYREGDTLAILPGDRAADAHPWADVVIPSGMGVARNVLLVRTADVIVAVGGAAGTLSELALAWQLGKPIVALAVAGWSGTLAGERIDDRPRDPIARASTPREAIEMARAYM